MIRYVSNLSFGNLWYHPEGLSGKASKVLFSNDPVNVSIRQRLNKKLKEMMSSHILPSSQTVMIQDYWNGKKYVSRPNWNDYYTGRIEYNPPEGLPPYVDAVQFAHRPKNPMFWERSRLGEIVCSNMHATNLLLDSGVRSQVDFDGSTSEGSSWITGVALDRLCTALGVAVLSHSHKVQNYNKTGVAIMIEEGVFVIEALTVQRNIVKRNSVVNNALSLGFPTSVLNHYSQYVNDPSVYEFNKELITQAHAEANSGHLDLLTTIAEVPETINGIMTQLKRVAGFTRNAFDKEKTILRLATNRRRKHYEKGRFAERVNSRESRKAAQSTTDAIAEVWMTWRYEIMPNVYTLVDYGNLLLNLNSMYKTTRELERQKIPTLKVDGWSCSHDSVTVKNNVFIKDRYNLGTLLEDLGRLLTTNLVVTGWELTKRSFVIDWFINIGEFLTSMFGYQNYQQRVASYSLKMELDVVYTHDQTGLEVRCWGEAYRRILIDSGAFLNLSARFDMNWKRYLDSISMLWPSLKAQMNSNYTPPKVYRRGRTRLKK